MDQRMQQIILARWREIPEPGRRNEDQAMTFLMELIVEDPEIMSGYQGGFQQLTDWLLEESRTGKSEPAGIWRPSTGASRSSGHNR
jgi:hypothetical protein